MAQKEKSLLESIADMGAKILPPKPKKPQPIQPDEEATINERTGNPFGETKKKK